MSIGTTIKKLRRERNITQEQLAEYLGITSRAVSQWECGRTAPDISQLPLLSNIFEVSADVLLEIDSSKKEEEICGFLSEYNKLSNSGDLIAKFTLTTKIYHKYPNDFRVTEKYLLELFNDPNYQEEPLGEVVHKDELYKLCNNILDYCTIQKIRYTAMDILSVLYLNDGLMEKAKAICEQFPESIYDTSWEMFEQLYIRCDKNKYEEFIKKNIRNTAEHLINKVRNYGTFVTKSTEDRICVYNKCIALIELIYENGDYGFTCYHLGHIYCLLAKIHHEKQDSRNAKKCLERGLYFCNEYDQLPKEFIHSSLLVKGDILNMIEIYNTTSMNRVDYEINEFLKNIDAKNEYTDIMSKY